jgi:hypothetical protein
MTAKSTPPRAGPRIWPSVERRALDRVQHAPYDGDAEQNPDLRIRKRRVAGKDEAASHQGRLRHEDHRPAVGGIREGAAQHREREYRDELQNTKQADQQQVVCQLVHLVRKGDDRDHAAEERHQPSHEQQSEIAVAPQRRDVDHRHVQPSTFTWRRGRRRHGEGPS